MADNSKKPVLRCITYMSPSYPIEFFEILMQYLEVKVGVETFLTVESRWSGPLEKRTDPFQNDLVDIGFLCSGTYLRYLNECSEYVDLVPAGAVFKHPHSQGRPVYFGDVIVRKDKTSDYKSFEDLKGCNFAFNDHESLSGEIVVLEKLKQMGENASFFSNIVQSGSHVNSIEMVISGQVDAACIDSNVLAIFRASHPARAKELATLHTFVPMPIFPILARRLLPEKLKVAICDALLKLHEDIEWSGRLAGFAFDKFVSTSPDLYRMETELREAVKNHSLRPAFY